MSPNAPSAASSPDLPAPSVDPDASDVGRTATRIRPRSLRRADVAGGDGLFDAGAVERSWTPVGTLDAGVLAEVDMSGAVRLTDASWSLDWWIGSEDRWHHPSAEAAVRQQCPGSAPIVETAMRVPGGDVLCRSYGVVARAGDWQGPAVVVEVENLTSVPVALAFAVRPLTLDGVGSIRNLRSDGPVVLVDGAPRLILSRDPARVVSGPLDSVADRLAAGDDSVGPLEATSTGGDLEAAFVVPLTHTAVARVLLPCVDSRDRRTAVPSTPWDAPDVEAVTGGWSVHGGDLWTSGPEPEWDGALTWADRMLRLAGADEVGAGLDRDRPRPAGPSEAERAAEIAEAMSRFGAGDALAPIARGLAEAQRLGGSVRMGDRSDATVALLHAVAGAMADASADGPVVEALLAPAAVAVRRVRRGKGVPSVLNASAVRALWALAPVLERIGQPEVAQDARSAAGSIAGSAGSVAGAAGSVAGSAGSTAGADSTTGEGAVVSTFAVASAVRSEIARSGPDAVAGLRSLWSGTSWRGRSDAERLDPGGASAVPAGVLGFDAAELAARTNALVDLFVSVGTDGGTTSPGGPSIMAGFDPAWVGRSIEAHDVPTPWGPVGYAVRWHGRRPAVLWEVTGADDDLELDAPGLDGTWRGRGAEGEALLGEIPVPETSVLIRLGGTGAATSTGDRS